MSNPSKAMAKGKMITQKFCNFLTWYFQINEYILASPFVKPDIDSIKSVAEFSAQTEKDGAGLSASNSCTCMLDTLVITIQYMK